MAAPHPHYPQPGPSTMAYHHNPPYQHQHQHQPPNGAPVGRAAYPPQGPGRPGPAYYQPGPYPPIEHQHQPPYQYHPGRPPQFIHPSPQRHPPPPPPFHSHVHHYPRSYPGPSLSALPKQLLMPPPPSPLQQHSLPPEPVPQPQQDPPPPPAQYPVVQPSSPAPQALSPSHRPLSDEAASPPLSPSSSVGFRPEPVESHETLPDRTNSRKGFSLKSRRPDVSGAVAVTVSSAARPPLSFYDLTASVEDDIEDAPPSPSVTASDRPVTPSQEVLAPPSQASISPDSPLQQSLASSATTATTPATSTAPHTPMPGSPLSSMTSVSLPAKSPSGPTLAASPSPSVQTIPTDAPAPAEEPAPAAPAPESQPSSPTPAPKPPVKKSWASLLRPAASGSTSTAGPTSPNSLPTSSVQGFSIPASLSAPAATHGPSLPRPNPGLVALLTSPNALVGPAPPIRARGLVNLRNMCFANTVLQVLMYCPSFHKLFTELGKYVLGPTTKTERREAGKGSPLVEATVAFIKEFQVLPPPPPSSRVQEEEEEDKAKDSFVPSYVYDALKEKKRFDSMRGGQQEDAEEFLGFYLDTLEEELLSTITSFGPTAPASVIVPVEEPPEEESHEDGWLEVGKKNKAVVTRAPKSAESPISRIFGGTFRTALRVPGARESAMMDPWSRLQLDIQSEHTHTIEDALRNIATPGTVQVTSSSRPGVQVDASQQTLIETLPPVLVLHLKRFLYDTTVNDVVKLSKRVTFEAELEIPKEAIAPARRSRPNKYKLFGVLNHHGSSATGGHYTLDVLHPDPRDKGYEGWIRIDDEFVQNIRAEDLLVRDVGDDRSAYLLFYRRISPPGPGARM